MYSNKLLERRDVVAGRPSANVKASIVYPSIMHESSRVSADTRVSIAPVSVAPCKHSPRKAIKGTLSKGKSAVGPTIILSRRRVTRPTQWFRRACYPPRFTRFTSAKTSTCFESSGPEAWGFVAHLELSHVKTTVLVLIHHTEDLLHPLLRCILVLG